MFDMDWLKRLSKRNTQVDAPTPAESVTPAHSAKMRRVKANYDLLYADADALAVHDLLRYAYRAGDMRFLYNDYSNKRVYVMYVFYSPRLLGTVLVGRTSGGSYAVKIGNGPVVTFDGYALSAMSAKKLIDGYLAQQRSANEAAVAAANQANIERRAAQSRELQAMLARIRAGNQGRGSR